MKRNDGRIKEKWRRKCGENERERDRERERQRQRQRLKEEGVSEMKIGQLRYSSILISDIFFIFTTTKNSLHPH